MDVSNRDASISSLGTEKPLKSLVCLNLFLNNKLKMFCSYVSSDLNPNNGILLSGSNLSDLGISKLKLTVNFNFSLKNTATGTVLILRPPKGISRHREKPFVHSASK